jgi:hypothetical protein
MVKPVVLTEGAEEFNTGYSSDVGLQRLTQVQAFLASFRRLTGRVQRRDDGDRQGDFRGTP